MGVLRQPGSVRHLWVQHLRKGGVLCVAASGLTNPEGDSSQLRSHDALACSLKAVAVARVVLCCDGATARKFVAAQDSRLQFTHRSCWIDAADSYHFQTRTPRPRSLTGVAHAQG